MRANLSNRDYELLSAYIDGQLAPGEQRRLEERMKARPEMRTAMDEMRRTRALLRQAPRRRAPRNFTLTPAMVGEQKRRSAPFFNLFPTLGFTSALAALALVVLVVMQLAPGTGQPQTIAMQPPAAQDSAVPEGEAAMKMMATDPAAAAAMAAPEEQPAAEQPAAEGQPAAKGPPAETPGAEILMAPAPEETTGPPVESTVPPVINWSDPIASAPMGMGGGGMGGGGDGAIGGGDGSDGSNLGPLMGPPPAPAGNFSGGMGGGAADGTYSGGAMVLPQASVESFDLSDKPIEPTPAAEGQAAEGQPAESGTGPLLGVPGAGETGAIVERKAIMGEETEGQPTNAAPVAPAVEPQPESELVATPEGLPSAAEGEQPAVEQQPAATEQATSRLLEESVPGSQAEAGSQAAAEGQLAAEEARQGAPDTTSAVPSGAVEADNLPARPLGLDPTMLLALQIALGAVALGAGAGAIIARRRAR